MKILIVDDSAFMRSMIKRILAEKNPEIQEASNFDDAVRIYVEFQPDIVFLDIIMPGKSGIETLKEIRSKNPEAKVIMCTSVGGQEKIIQECVAAGASDFITKPFTPDEINSVLAKFTQG